MKFENVFFTQVIHLYVIQSMGQGMFYLLWVT